MEIRISVKPLTKLVQRALTYIRDTITQNRSDTKLCLSEFIKFSMRSINGFLQITTCLLHFYCFHVSCNKHTFVYSVRIC